MNTGERTISLEGMRIVLCAREIEEVEPVGALLTRLGCLVETAESPEEVFELVARVPADAILAHICPSRQHFFAILGRPELPPVIPLLCHADKHLYIETLRRGAFDCVPLPVDQTELIRVLTLAAKQHRSQFAVGATI
jgi:DNA-binding NtrC family response regulator